MQKLQQIQALKKRKEIKEIGFSKFRLYTRIYKVIGWGFKRSKKGKKTDKTFIEIECIELLSSCADSNILNQKIQTNYPLKVWEKNLNFEILE